ncbi:MAG: cyclic 2,3-diphosphoglycerate synthase [Desulfurococcaceae archaeon]|jgi:predicted GTPase|nr:cyclic 2,3-diphosphoglycerate synthase [Desulfurococcaceae archaeon]
MAKRRVVIVGAGGRDLHNFNMVFKNNPEIEVVAFLFTQIPGVEFRRCPSVFAGENYPNGIPIYPIDMLPNVVKFFGVDEVVLSLSDLMYDELGKLLSYILSTGCSFRILGFRETMLDSVKPVLAVTATKTGAGKSTVSRVFVKELVGRGLKVAVVRHPMVYGDIEQNLVQVFRSLDDLDRYRLTVEEREEYEPHLELGAVVLAGIDYRKVLVEAEKVGNVILWDGGNNDWPFFRPWYWVTVTDATRPGIEVKAFPGEVNLRLADTVIITKVGSAKQEDIEKIINNIKIVNPSAKIVKADMEVKIDKPNLVAGKRVVVVEDAPTVTHGGSQYGAGYVAAKKYGAEVVDPKKYAVGVIKKIYEDYPHIGPVVPSLGYTEKQLKDLETTINNIDADVVILATPAKIEKLIKINKPIVRVSWELTIIEGPSIKDLVDEFLSRKEPKTI